MEKQCIKIQENQCKIYLQRLAMNGEGGSGADLSNYYTKAEIDAMIGNIGQALDAINGEVA